MRVVSSLILSLLLTSSALAEIIPKKSGISTLVLLDDYSIVETHSIFFDSLVKDGHVLHYEMITPNAPSIKYYDEYYYDNIILMAPSVKELRNPITISDLKAYLEANHNLLIFGDTDAKKPIRSLVNEFGMEFENAGYEARDYNSDLQYDKEKNVVFSKNLFSPFLHESKGIFSQSEKPVAFSGVAMTLDPENLFVFPILRAEESTFSFNSEQNEISKISGEQLTLVAGYQARKNQRVATSGSISMCSNQYMLMTLG